MNSIDPRQAKERLGRLTDRELQLIRLRCDGLEWQAIGKRLGLSKSAVAGEKKNAFVKLDLDGLSEFDQTKGLLQSYWPILENLEPGLGEDRAEANREGAGASSRTDAGDRERGPAASQRDETPGGRQSGGGRQPSRIGCWIAAILVVGMALGAGGIYLWLRSQNGPVPFLPVAPIPQQSSTGVPPTATVQAPTQAPPVVPTDSATASPQPTSTPIPTDTPFLTNTPKSFYEQGQAVVLKDGIYMQLMEGFNTAGGPCGKPDPGFGVGIRIDNTTQAEFLVRFDSGGFAATDDVGTEYRLVRIGVNQSGFCSDAIGVPLQYNLSNITDYTRISMQFEGQIPLQAQYLLITADWVSGVGPTVFKKQLY